MRDLVKKLKLETEIKENQVRSLKVKLEHYEAECQNLKNSVREASSDQQSELQMRKAQNKLKKTEGVLKKSLEALKKIAREVVGTHQNSSKRTTVQHVASKEPCQQIVIS